MEDVIATPEDTPGLKDAPGAPGIEPRWTSSDKSGVGTALSPLSRVWFTLSHGIVNEVYYPRVDQACIRDFGLIVTDGGTAGFFAEEKRDTGSEVEPLDDGVPAFRFVNTHKGGRFRIRKRVVTDAKREVLLQKVRLEVLNGGGPLRLFALLAPHLVNVGRHNSGWLGEYKGVPMLFAEGGGTALALACSAPWAARSVGFVGVSDGWQLLHRDGKLTEYQRAADGNVALTGEIELPPSGDAVLALGFGRTPAEAAFRTRASLFDDFGEVEERYAQAWRAWQKRLRPLDRLTAAGHNSYRTGTAVLRTHDSPSFPGGLIASLSIPWGASKGDNDLGGYHLVWPRDLVQTAGALLAAGAGDEAVKVLDYLRAIQDANGRWPQNAWLDGRPYWDGVQMDECAFPILLADLARREGALPPGSSGGVAGYWPMVRKAVGFLVCNGPATSQDRWEENAGYSCFTLAVEIAGLLAAADLAEQSGEARLAPFLRDTADAWFDMLDSWTWASGTPLAKEAGVPGYYVRIAPTFPPGADTKLDATVPIRNRPDGENTIAANALVSPDALAYVRFGLRRADDPRMVATMKVLDHALKRELAAGPYWYRYNGDGYGEHPDGSAYDGTGQGRLWPLLTGERAHVALAAGDRAEAMRLLAALEAAGSPGGMLPEQIWDTDPIPDRELEPGRPSGSAMPLVWAHSEHVKLLRSLADGQVYDMPPQTRERYLERKTTPRVQVWRPGFRTARLPAGRALRLDLPQPATVRWTTDGGTTWRDAATLDTGLGFHAAELPTEHLAPGTELAFRWAEGEEARAAVV